MKYHDFGRSLSESHKAEDLPLWEECYRKAFPNFQAMANHRSDGDHQRNGIDRSIILQNSKQILIDEKFRTKAYSDIALEYLSDSERGVLGWVCKPLLCDYIAYAIGPLGKCYLLPVVQLQKAWSDNKDKWMNNFTIRAENKCAKTGRRWVTLSKAVSVKDLFSAMGNCLRVDFTPVEENGS